MQFLKVSKNCQVTWLEYSTFWKKSYFNFALNIFYERTLNARSYLKIKGVARGVAKGAWAPSIEMPPTTKN